jgi:hypothetical protein
VVWNLGLLRHVQAFGNAADRQCIEASSAANSLRVCEEPGLCSSSQPDQVGQGQTPMLLSWPSTDMLLCQCQQRAPDASHCIHANRFSQYKRPRPSAEQLLCAGACRHTLCFCCILTWRHCVSHPCCMQQQAAACHPRQQQTRAQGIWGQQQQQASASACICNNSRRNGC